MIIDKGESLMGDKNNGIHLKDFLLGAVVGGVVGATIALLTAPKTGKEMRKDLSKGYETAKEKSSEIYQTVKASTEDVIEKLNDVSELIQDKWIVLKDTIPKNQVSKVPSSEMIPEKKVYISLDTHKPQVQKDPVHLEVDQA
jgi:gas vesicle protein